MRKTSFIFFVKLIFVLSISYIATKTVPYSGSFSYKNKLLVYNLPQFIFFLLLLDLFNGFGEKNRLYWGILLFSLVNIVLPTATGTLSSVPRYALFSFSLYFFLSRLNNKLVKSAAALIFLALQIVLISLFIQGYFVSQYSKI